MARRHTRPKERKRRDVLRYIPQEDVAEKKELPDWEENVQREIPVEPEMQMMPEIPEMEEFDIRAYEKKKRKERKKRIKKNPRKNWKELGLLEKRGLA